MLLLCSQRVKEHCAPWILVFFSLCTLALATLPHSCQCPLPRDFVPVPSPGGCGLTDGPLKSLPDTWIKAELIHYIRENVLWVWYLHLLVQGVLRCDETCSWQRILNKRVWSGTIAGLLGQNRHCLEMQHGMLLSSWWLFATYSPSTSSPRVAIPFPLPVISVGVGQSWQWDVKFTGIGF